MNHRDMWHPENTTETKAHHSETPEENKIDEKFAEDLEKLGIEDKFRRHNVKMFLKFL
jgi:hypothetical protein